MRLVIEVPKEPGTVGASAVVTPTVGGTVRLPSVGIVGSVVHVTDRGRTLEITIDIEDDHLESELKRLSGPVSIY